MSDARQTWGAAVFAAVAGTALLVFVFWPTVSSMVHQWMEYGSYSHGFLILPISLWLVWRQRDSLRMLSPNPAPWVLILVLAATALWLLARVLGIQVVEQLAFVGIWITVLWALLGHQLSARLRFPLLFLLTMVPMGAGLEPPLMDFTADFTVWMLDLTGIPVYREGLHFVVPSGSWSVVKACSGVRYLVASVTLGLVYAHLTYHSRWRQGLFLLMAVVVPILANGLRAYMIVMIGHLSDMKLAVGVDHLIYGWVFFGMVMLVLFWLGGFWMDDRPEIGKQQPISASPKRPSSMRALVVACGIVLVSLGGGSLSNTLSGDGAVQPQPFRLPESVSGWSRVDESPDWPAAIPEADQIVQAMYRKGDNRVFLKLGLYRYQRQGHEVVSGGNRLLAGKNDLGWRVTGHVTAEFEGASRTLYSLTKQGESLVASAQEEMVATQWYRLGKRETANAYLGKFYQGLNLITQGRTDGALVLLAADRQGGVTPLQDFNREVLSAVWDSWDRYVATGSVTD